MIKSFEKKKTSESESIMSINLDEKIDLKKSNCNDFMTHFLFFDPEISTHNNKQPKNYKILDIKKQVEFQKNQKFFPIKKEKSLLKEKTNKNELPKKSSKIYITKKKKTKDCKMLLKLLKNYFFHGILEREKKIKNLNNPEKSFLVEILFLDSEFVLKNDYILQKKIQRSLKNILKNHIAKFYNGKKLNFIRKLFKIVLKKLKDKKSSHFQKLGLKIKKKELLNEFFNFPSFQIMDMLRVSIKEFKKRDTLLCFSFPLFRKEFDFELDFLMEEKWRIFRDVLILKFEGGDFGEKENFIFREALEHLCLYSSGYVYLKNIYSCLD